MNFTLSNSCTVTDTEDIKQYTLTFFNSIQEVPGDVWNANMPEANLLMQYDYLKLIEETQGSKLGYRYVFAKKDDVIIGAMYFQVVRFEGADLLNYFPDGNTGFSKYFWGAMKAVFKPVFLNLNPQMLVSGNIFMTGESGFYFHAQLNRASRARILRKAIQDIRNADKRIKGVAVSDLYEPKSVFDKEFVQCDYSEITLEPDMSIKMRNEWGNFNDYLSSLTSKYRVRTKKVLALCHENEVIQKELAEDDIIKYEDRLFELYQLVMDKAEFKLGTFTKDYFATQKKQLPHNYRVFGYFKDGEMLSFISFFHNGTKMDVHYVGMDESKCKPIHLYQHMLYDMINIGIENKFDKLHFGRTAPEIKSTVGAVPSNTYGYVKHFNPTINRLILRPLTKRMKPKNYVYRNPFKE